MIDPSLKIPVLPAGNIKAPPVFTPLSGSGDRDWYGVGTWHWTCDQRQQSHTAHMRMDIEAGPFHIVAICGERATAGGKVKGETEQRVSIERWRSPPSRR
jgi:hypothetical protein